MLNLIFILAAIALPFVSPAYPQDADTVRRFQRFETDWLSSLLNVDTVWEQDLLHRKFFVLPKLPNEAAARRMRVAELLEPPLPQAGFKVRITGTISLLTSDLAKNRSFRFLDTFNKKDGKWQLIAESASPTSSDTEIAGASENAEAEIIKFENELTGSDIGDVRSNFDRLLAPDFVGAIGSGAFLDRDAWIKRQLETGPRQAAASSLSFRMVAVNVAIVTGILAAGRTRTNEWWTNSRLKFMHTWIKKEGRWQIATAHVSQID